MRREIRDLQQRLGMTMVYVTHDQTEAMSMADTIILMQHGHIVQNDAPVAMYSKPATTFAASFIGTPAHEPSECCHVQGAGGHQGQ